MDMAKLMQQAQAMQNKMKDFKAGLSEVSATGKAGDDLVKVSMTGENRIQTLEISDALLLEDKDMIEDMIISAVNDAHSNVAELIKSKTKAMTDSLGLPSGIDLPL